MYGEDAATFISSIRRLGSITTATFVCQLEPREGAEYVERLRKETGIPNLEVPITEYNYYFPVNALKNDVDDRLTIKFTKPADQDVVKLEFNGMHTMVIGKKGYELELKKSDVKGSWTLLEKLTKRKWRITVKLLAHKKLKIVFRDEV